MILLRYLVSIGSALLLTSESPESSCINTEATLVIIKSHTERALDERELNLIRFYAFKALNTIEDSKAQLEDCSCDYVRKNLSESLENLKLATQVSTLEGVRIPLLRALEYTQAGLQDLKDHGTLHKPDGVGKLGIIKDPMMDEDPEKRLKQEDEALKAIINNALVNYEKSMEEVVKGVPCEEALEFVRRIYAHCEKQLLQQDLSAAKKYYNIRTREISENALAKLKKCSP